MRCLLCLLIFGLGGTGSDVVLFFPGIDESSFFNLLLQYQVTLMLVVYACVGSSNISAVSWTLFFFVAMAFVILLSTGCSLSVVGVFVILMGLVVFACLFACQFVCLSVCLFVCLSV